MTISAHERARAEYLPILPALLGRQYGSAAEINRGATGPVEPRLFKVMTRRNVLLGGGALAVVGAGAAYAVTRHMGSLEDYEASVADHRLFVSLGCAAENLALASGARGRPGELRFDSSTDGSAVFEFSKGTANASPLFDAIHKRQSSRDDYDGKAVRGADLDTLATAAAVPGVDLI